MISPYRGKFRVSQTQHANHDGLDLVGVDSKEVYSIVAGTVERAGWEDSNNKQKGFGLYVRIKQTGSNDRYYFGHLSSVAVKEGDTVKVGQKLGVEGSTGNSTGSHVHLCCRTDADRNKVQNISAITGIPNALGTYNADSVFAPDVIYQVRADNRWLPSVKNLEDYAGNDKAITDIAIKVTEGAVKYRVHINGGDWLPWVTGYDANDSKNGYAGNGKPIDAIEVYYTTPAGKPIKKVKYRIMPVGGKDYYSWQHDSEKTNGQDGYAGMFGGSIGRVQVVVG